MDDEGPDDDELRKRQQEIMECWKAVVRRYSWSLGRGDAEDVASETVSRFLKHLDKYGWNAGWPDNLKHYMSASARNLSIEWGRSGRITRNPDVEKRIEKMEDDGPTPAVAALHASVEDCIDRRLAAYIAQAPNARDRGWRENRVKAIRMLRDGAEYAEISKALEHKDLNVTYVFMNSCKAHIQEVVRPCTSVAGGAEAVA